MKLFNELLEKKDEDGLRVLGCFSVIVGFIILVALLLLIFAPKVLLWIIIVLVIIIAAVFGGYYICEWAYGKIRENKEAKKTDKY